MKPSLVIALCFQACMYAQLAVVKVPLVDISGRSLAQFSGPLEKHYENLAFAPDKGKFSCIRIHQLKFNEIVTIVSDPSSEEVHCVASNFYYLDEKNKKKHKFWMLKKYLLPLNESSKLHIPFPIDLTKSSESYNTNILTLKEPLYDMNLKQWYSVGTRFVRHSKKDTQDRYAVYRLNKNLDGEDILLIPKQLAVVTYPKTQQKAITKFIDLLKQWTHGKNGIVSYVYGGCSFIKRSADKGYTLIKGNICGHPVTYWKRKGDFQLPLAGFDCSALILTAAQICGMPYYCKNTLALKEGLRPLEQGEPIENGDLIWYDHHVMIVTDVKNNLLLEAVGYDSGYGKLHEAHIKKLFRGIKNYKDLIRFHHTGRSTMRFTKKGRPYKTIRCLKILKLKSLWDMNPVE